MVEKVPHFGVRFIVYFLRESVFKNGFPPNPKKLKKTHKKYPKVTCYGTPNFEELPWEPILDLEVIKVDKNALFLYKHTMKVVKKPSDT